MVLVSEIMMTLALFKMCGGNNKTWVTAIIFLSLSYFIVWILSAVFTVSLVFTLVFYHLNNLFYKNVELILTFIFSF